MEYERIHKVQVGIISPSKLRMKLLGVHNSRRKEGGSNSSRTSPSKLEDSEYAKNHLLTSDLDEEVGSIDSKQIANSVDPKLEKTEMICSKSQNITKTNSYQIQSSTNLSTVHPVRSLEEDGNGCDSGHDNGSTSSFEFPQGDRSSHGPFFRHVPSKWNDAEKWIVNRQTIHQNGSKKKVPHSQGIRKMISNTRRIELITTNSQNLVGKFSFVPHHLQPQLVTTNEMSELANFSQGIGDSKIQGRLEEREDQKAFVLETPIPTVTGNQTVESVSMRDIGTEMTPIPSQEPSRIGTPCGATTPSRSPRSSSLTNTPKADENDCKEKCSKPELSESEMKLKTRREIAALGMKLGKKNIASWASKEAEYCDGPSPKNFEGEKNVKQEYEARAAGWEEAEKARHMARYKQEEVKIQLWESHQRAKIEARMRKLEDQAGRMRTQGQEKIVQKLAETRQQVEERRAEAEARKNQKAVKTAQQVEQIRKTGRTPPSHIRCCSWLM